MVVTSPGWQRCRHNVHHLPHQLLTCVDDHATWHRHLRITHCARWGRRNIVHDRSNQVFLSALVEPVTETWHHSQTASFVMWSCHLTCSIVRKQHIWKTFSLSHNARDNIQHSHPWRTVGMINVWSSFMCSFTGRVVLQKTSDKDLKMSRPLNSFASVPVESDGLDVGCTPKYLNDSTYLTVSTTFVWPSDHSCCKPPSTTVVSQQAWSAVVNGVWHSDLAGQATQHVVHNCCPLCWWHQIQ